MEKKRVIFFERTYTRQRRLYTGAIDGRLRYSELRNVVASRA